MSQVAPRAIALQEAGKLGLLDPSEIVTAAEKFVAFIMAGESGQNAPPTTVQMSITGNAPGVAPQVAPQVAPKVAPRVAPQVAPKVAPRAAPKVAPVVAPKVATEADPAAPTVKSVVDSLLAAGKRDEAVALLKKFGATSVSGVKAAVADDFIAEGTAILNGEDLTS